MFHGLQLGSCETNISHVCIFTNKMVCLEGDTHETMVTGQQPFAYSSCLFFAGLKAELCFCTTYLSLYTDTYAVSCYAPSQKCNYVHAIMKWYQYSAELSAHLPLIYCYPSSAIMSICTTLCHKLKRVFLGLKFVEWNGNKHQCGLCTHMSRQWKLTMDTYGLQFSALLRGYMQP